MAPDSDQFQTPIRDVDLNQVAIFHECDGAAIERLGRDMANRWAFGRAGKTPIGDNRRRMCQCRIGGDDRCREIHLGHPVGARPLITNDHDIAWLDFARQQCLDCSVLEVEHPRWSDVHVHLGRHGEVLDHRSTWRQVAVQHGNATIWPEWVRARPDDLVVAHPDVVQVAARFGEESTPLDVRQTPVDILACGGPPVHHRRTTGIRPDSGQSSWRWPAPAHVDECGRSRPG